ncbi:hypothetical protein SAMN05444487_105126 [Marininema mesophilum]|uniref:Zinc ribbon domain-containing protein n=1 Tax=Marininema mesophilum TaxID=1048340 RepID=A0A1H2VJA8_9BACL|nr:hypothetical protein [Marininema mesophilum]SDW68397.1 hypothetical protein SAMN05444487_105126 [Marininema mesophilum]
MGIFDGLKSKLEKGLETTSQKSKKVLDISRLTLQLRGKKEYESELHMRLGRSLYERWEAHGDMEMTDRTRSLLYNIKEIREVIQSMEDQLTELKKEEERKHPPENMQAPPSREVKTERQALPSGDDLPGERIQSSSNQTPVSDHKTSSSWDAWEGQGIFLCPHCSKEVRDTEKNCIYCHGEIYS